MSICWMFSVCGVVAAVEGAAVVADGVAVVAGAGHAVRVPGEAQSCQGERHSRAQLLPESLSRGKSFQVNNKNLG